jgi:hypothetical protein
MRNVVFDMGELLTYVNLQNGTNDVFVSLYQYTEGDRLSGKFRVDHASAVVDKLFLDLDGRINDEAEEKNPLKAFEDAQRIHAWALDHHYRHAVFFSGSCYQIYFLIERNLQYPSNAMGTFLQHFGKEHNVLIDKKIRGNLAQLVRYPNTWNPKGQRFCVCLKDFEHLTHQQILRIARKQQPGGIILYGDTLLDLKPWDTKPLGLEDRVESVNWTPQFAAQLEEKVRFFKSSDIAPCVQRLMTNQHLGYEGRWLIIVYLHERALPKSITVAILQSFLSPKKFIHCTRGEAQMDGGMVNYIYNKADENGGEGYYMWSCEKMQQNGYCVKGCTRKHPIYK